MTRLKRKRICIVTTVPYALMMFMRPHIDMFASQYDVTLVTNGVENDVHLLLGEHVHFLPLNIQRRISLWSDIRALLDLVRIFRRGRFDVVHSLTPKTGLLAMLAGVAAGAPNRIHTFTGQVWVNKKGLSRFVLKMFDKVIAMCATRLLADSFSQREFLIDQHIVDAAKIQVLGHGSVCGVDVERFKPDAPGRSATRKELGIPDDAIVYLFLGRLNRDKGVQDLGRAFVALAQSMPNVHLIVVGPDEGGMDDELQKILQGNLSRFHRVGFTREPEKFMACADILCLPSYREGFGSVIIEGAAMGMPSVVSNIYGLTDAVVNSETGILHEPRNIGEIELALRTLSLDSEMREKMGRRAQDRVHSCFTRDISKNAMQDYYKLLLS